MPADATADKKNNFFTALYADDSLLVLNKPAGLLAVPGRGDSKQDSLSSRVQQHYPDALVVHRLDMSTSGLMLMARGSCMQKNLSRLFQNRQIYKRYIAVVDGDMRPHQLVEDWRLIDLPIAVDWPHRPLRIIDAHRGKPSQTQWRVLAFDATMHTTWLELEPITGRSHQLRVHLQALGHPIVGDALYAPEHVRLGSTRLLLHATRLAFIHPANGQALCFESTPDF